MSHGKIQPQKGYELVIRELQDQIKEGVFQPGDKLPSVVNLAASLGVGRSTLREALSALKAMGWLDIRQGGGTYVKAVPPPAAERGNGFHNADSLREILEVRKLLETGCAELAARNRTDADLVRLEQTLIRMEAALDRHDQTAGEQADVEFHLQISRAAGNSLLISLMESLSNRMHETIRDTRELWFYQEKSTAARLLEEHRGIYQAIRDRQPRLAAERVQAHLLKVENVLKQALGTEWE